MSVMVSPIHYLSVSYWLLSQSVTITRHTGPESVRITTEVFFPVDYFLSVFSEFNFSEDFYFDQEC